MPVGALLVIAAGIPLAGALNVWIDEAFTLYTTGAGPFVAWSQAISFEGQPPLYFVLESLWRAMNENSIAFARLSSVLCAAAAVAVIVAAANRIVPRVPPLGVAIAAGANPIVLWAAVEMRVYALVLLLGALLNWAFFEGFSAPRTSGRARALYVVFATAGLYTQYYVGFVLAAQFVTLLLVRRRAARAMAFALVLVASAFAPFVPVVLGHLATSDAFVERLTFARALYAVLNAAFVFALPHEQDWSGALRTGGIAATLLLALAVVLCRPGMPAGAARVAGLQWLLSLLALGVAFAAGGVPLESLRHLIVLVPSTSIAGLVCLESLARARRPAIRCAAVVFVLFCGTEFSAQYHPPLAKIGEWNRVAATIAAGDPTAPVAVFPAELALPLRYSLDRTTIPIPRPMPFTIDYVRTSTLTVETDVARVLEPVRARAARLWLVTGGPCEPLRAGGYDYHCGVLERYVQRRYRVERSIAFRGALVRLLVRRPNLWAAGRRRNTAAGRRRG